MSSKVQEHVIVKGFSTVEIRQPIEVLMSNPKYKKQRDLFLQGFSKVQERKKDDPKSFYAVAGIHGLPFVAYDKNLTPTDWNEKDSKRWGGYCHHGDILFPTWHRPYVLLLEMLIYEEAEQIVKDYGDVKGADEYKQELKKVRFPYWDWASPSTLIQGVPSVIFDEYVDIEDPNGKSRIRNPLRAYTLPDNLGTLFLVGDISNPTQRPYKPGNETPYTPTGYATVRHPNINYRTTVDATSLNVVTFCSAVFRPTLCQVLLSKKWSRFSNHGDLIDGEFDENYGHFSSIEVVHDALHDAIGGTGGHMSYPDIASFDPIFFLHHANVDRLVAIWQACHPDAWIIGNDNTVGTFTDEYKKPIDANTDLTPFRKTKDTYWNSNEVRYIKNLGYSYIEFSKYKPEDLLKEMLKYYHPNRYLRYHWKLNLVVKKHKVGSPFQIRVFLDLPTAGPSTPLNSPNYAGLVSIFARGKETNCANCISNPEAVVRGHVDLTACMERLSIDLNNEPEPDGTFNPKHASLKPNQIKLVAVLKDQSGISLEDAGLIYADYWSIDEDSDDPEQWVKTKIGVVYDKRKMQKKSTGI